MESDVEKELLSHIEKIRHSGSIIIVEGKKDKIALEKLGIKTLSN